ncbi:MAG: SRPBCC family protein [Bacteroidota bacterium]
MKGNTTSKVSCGINAPASKVWEILTTPQLTKTFFFGTEADSDWEPGSPIKFRSSWAGKFYDNVGIVLTSKRNKLLRFLVSATDDQVYIDINVTYELQEKDEATKLTVTQENLPDESTKENAEYNWSAALENVKQIAEKQSKRSSAG